MSLNLSLIVKSGIEVVGDVSFRGDCPLEDADLITLIQKIRREYPMFDPIHVKNEKKRKGKQFIELANERKKGSIITGWVDICVPGFPTLFIELKRQDPTQSDITSDQIDFLVRQQAVDCWCFVALGWEAGWQCFMKWLKENYPKLVKKTCNQKIV